jgi:hypothetical protein
MQPDETAQAAATAVSANRSRVEASTVVPPMCPGHVKVTLPMQVRKVEGG